MNQDIKERFVERASKEGLVDVSYTLADSPFGPLFLASTKRGLVRVSFKNEDFDEVMDDLSAEVSPRILEAPAALAAVERQLDRYFDGKLRDFDLPLDWRLTKGFRKKVLRATARLPYGATSTYMEMATRAGNPRAYRAAGSALGSNPIPIVVPCHRVLATGGGLGGYGGGLEMKKGLLKIEGALKD